MIERIVWTDGDGTLREVLLDREVFPPLVAPGPARKSQESQESQAVHGMYQLGPLELDLFEERAAIMEYDGGLDRSAAEARAMLAVLAGRRPGRTVEPVLDEKDERAGVA